MRFVGPPTPRLIRINFVHLFMVSLLPFATAWVAPTTLARHRSLSLRRSVRGCRVAYNLFEGEVLARADATHMSERTRRMARRRSLGVLAILIAAMLVALVAPGAGFGLICGALILHAARGPRPRMTWRAFGVYLGWLVP
jgi:uncharacterized membrane protein